MTQKTDALHPASPPHDAPALQGIPLSETDVHGPVRLLSDRQRQVLAAIATRVRVPRRTILYRERMPAKSVFIVGDGVVKVFRDLRSGKRPVLAFLFAQDVFGLAARGLYVNTAQAVTDVTMFQFPREILKDTLARDSQLQLQFLIKVTHELRESQRHTIVVGRRDAAGRLATLLRSLEERSWPREPGMIDIPMSRSDVAGYLGLSLESVSRACRKLERCGIVTFVDRHRARVVDRRGLDRLASAD